MALFELLAKKHQAENAYYQVRANYWYLFGQDPEDPRLDEVKSDLDRALTILRQAEQEYDEECQHTRIKR